MTASIFLPFGRHKNGIVGLTVIPTFVYSDDKWDTARLVRGVSLEQRMERIEASPRRARAMQQARIKLSSAMASRNKGRNNLAALRLAAGLSQTQLATRMETQQSNISRWESDPSTMLVESVQKMARALGVDPSQVFAATILQPEVA